MPNPTSWVDPFGLANFPISYWPSNNGAIGKTEITRLEPGALVDRYGYPGGRYLSPAGTPYSMRALPPGTEFKPYTMYEVVKPISSVETSKIAPWFGEQGLGEQHRLPQSVQSYLDSGHLKEVKVKKCG